MGKDDEDDYTFGDFTFASFPSSAHYHPQINVPNLTPIQTHISSNNHDDDDDEWTDFVKSPIRSDNNQLSNAPSHTQSKASDPFGFFSQNNNNDSTNSSESTQPGIASESAQVKNKADWEKPKGPLPLSLFGDIEEEEEEEGERSGVNDSQGGYGKDSLTNVQNGSNNVSLNVGFNDILANLYKYNTNQQIKAEKNGFVSDQNGSNLDVKGVNLNDKDSILCLNQLSLSSGSVDLKKDLENNDQKVKSEDNFKFNSNGSGSNPNAGAAGLDISGWSNSFSGVSSGSSPGSILNDQSKLNKGENEGKDSNISRLGSNQNASSSHLNATSSSFGGWTLDFGGFSSSSNMLNANLNAASSSFNGLSSNRKNEELNGNGNDNDDDDDGWEFKGACSEAKPTDRVDKADPKTREMSDKNTQSSGFGTGSNGSIDFFAFSDGPVDLFSMSNGVSGDSVKVGTELNIKPTTAAQTSFNSDTFLRSEPTGTKSDLGSNLVVRAAENDEDFGEFTAVFPEIGLKKEGELKANDISVPETKATSTVDKEQVKVAAKVYDESQLNAYAFSSGNGSSSAVDLFALSNESIDLFATSNVVSSASLSTDFDTMPSTAAQSSFIFHTHLNHEQTNSKDGLDPQPVLEVDENDEDFGEFTAAISETEQKQEGELPSDHPQTKLKETASDGKDLGKEMSFGNKKGALPLSIFGDEELEVDNSLSSENAFLHSPSPVQGNGPNPTSVISINDLISNLYSQAEQNTSVDTLNGTTNIEVSPTTGVNSNLMNDGDDFNDGSWEFKDAFVPARAENEKSLDSAEDAHQSDPSKVDAHQSSPSRVRLDSYVDFYSKLKDAVSFVIKFHLENLKEARSTAALSGQDDKVMELDEENQEVYKQLDQETIIFQEDSSEGHPTKDSSLNEFLEALQEQKFQILESEYGLSQRLSSAEKDLRSALELRKHAITMLKILRVGSLADHLTYISIWSKMISVCVQELQSGANIWKQSLERNVVNELLFEPEGKKFIQALGEIYRVAMVLGASAKLYKPWTFESSGESTHIYALLDECTSVWSTSGLGEALSDILHSTSTDDKSGIAALVDSILYIRDLDLLALQDHALTQPESGCQLSLLTSESIPGLKVVVWDGEQYFVKLANMWANLISRDPPNLPHLHVLVDEVVG